MSSLSSRMRVLKEYIFLGDWMGLPLSGGWVDGWLSMTYWWLKCLRWLLVPVSCWEVYIGFLRWFTRMVCKVWSMKRPCVIFSWYWGCWWRKTSFFHIFSLYVIISLNLFVRIGRINLILWFCSTRFPNLALIQIIIVIWNRNWSIYTIYIQYPWRCRFQNSSPRSWVTLDFCCGLLLWTRSIRYLWGGSRVFWICLLWNWCSLLVSSG